jgi:hypothetical protein
MILALGPTFVVGKVRVSPFDSSYAGHTTLTAPLPPLVPDDEYPGLPAVIVICCPGVTDILLAYAKAAPPPPGAKREVDLLLPPAEPPPYKVDLIT